MDIKLIWHLPECTVFCFACLESIRGREGEEMEGEENMGKERVSFPLFGLLKRRGKGKEGYVIKPCLAKE